MNIEGVRVTIVDITYSLENRMQEDGIATEAFIVNPYLNAYTIFYNPTNHEEDAIMIIAHELIHLKQYHEGRLKVLPQANIIFQSDTVRAKEIPYMERAWEIEAFGKQGALSREIQKKI